MLDIKSDREARQIVTPEHRFSQSIRLLSLLYEVGDGDDPRWERFRALLVRWRFRDLWRSACESAALDDPDLYKTAEKNADFAFYRAETFENYLVRHNYIEPDNATEVFDFYSRRNGGIGSVELVDEMFAAQSGLALISGSAASAFSREEANDVQQQYVMASLSLPTPVLSGVCAEWHEFH